MNLLGKNLTELRNKKALTQQQIADIVGVGKVTWSDYERGKSEPNISVLTKISEFFLLDLDDLIKKDLSNAHLMEEIGEYKKGQNAHLNAHPTAHLIDPKHGIPLIPVEAMAGMTNGDVQITESDVLKRYIVPEFTELGVNFIIQAKGSSMLPKYNSGDLLACKKLKDISFFQWGKVYVLDTDQGPLVKRLFKAQNESSIQCVSDNKERYPPFDLPMTSIRSIAIVVGVIRLE